jgi:hypothetical protein
MRRWLVAGVLAEAFNRSTPKEAFMKSVLVSSLAGVFAVLMLAGASPSAAQEIVAPGSYDGYYDYGRPVPPRPIPNVASETVVTTTRRVVTAPTYDGYGPPQAVVTTRKVVTTAPAAPLDLAPAGFALPPPPPRRIVKDVLVAPAFGEPVVTRRIAPAQPVVIEERRVETTRRIIGPSPDWTE